MTVHPPVKRPRHRLVLLSCVATMFVGFATTAREQVQSAETPATRWVGSDAALYAELTDPGALWTQIESSPLRRHFLTTPLGVFWHQAAARQRWTSLDDRVEQKTGRTLTSHLRRLFDRKLAIALFWPEHGQPQGMLLGQGTTSEDVAETIMAWNQVDPPASLKEIPHPEGGSYTARTTGKAATVYYAIQGEWFVLSDQEELVRKVVERWQHAEETTGSLEADPFLTRLWPEAAVAGDIRAYLSARRWDRGVAQALDDSAGAQALHEAWMGTSAISVDGSLRPEALSLRVTAHFEDGPATTSWQEWTDRPSGLAAVAAIPGDALLAVCGGCSPSPAIRLFRSMMPPSEGREWDQAMGMIRALLHGADPWQDAAPRLFGDFATYIVARPATAGTARTIPWVLGWISHSAQPMPPEQLLSLENGLSFVMNLLVVATASDPRQAPADSTDLNLVHSRTSSEQTWILEGRRSSELAVALSPSHILVTTDRTELSSLSERAIATSRPATPVADAYEHYGSPDFLAWVSLKECRQQDTWRQLTAAGTGDKAHEPLLRGPPALLLIAGSLVQIFDEAALWVDWEPAKASAGISLQTRP